MRVMLLLLSVGIFASNSFAQQKPQAPKVPVVLASSQLQDVPVWLRAVGQVKSLQNVEIRPQVDGVLQQILVQEGQQVQQGQLLAVLDDRAPKAALAQTKAQLALVQAKLAVAKRDLQRFVNLSQSQAISAQQKDQQQALVQQLSAEIASSEAAVAAAQVQLSFTQIVSPVAGQVGIRNVDVGNYVRPAESAGLFSVIQQSPISVEMAVPQGNIPELQALTMVMHQQIVPAHVFAQDGSMQLASGKLSVIDNKVGAGSGTIRVKAEFTNTDKALWPGQTVVMALQSKLLSQVVTIPVKALQQGPQGSFIWQIRDEQATPTLVEVVFTNEQLVVVTGINAGVVVVVDGHSRLRPGAMVQELTNTNSAAKQPAATMSGQAVATKGSP
jgi:RND family efflux transporter MFP subunit